MLAGVATLSDDELDRLAVTWRLRARRGDREAFGLAHALEVEQRRRHAPPCVVVNPACEPSSQHAPGGKSGAAAMPGSW